jgi:hypothetical protein
MEIAMKLKTLIAVAVAGAFPALALAQSATSQPQEGRTPPGAPASPGSIDQRSGTAPSGTTAGSTALFNRLDRNSDGFISRDEARDATELQGRFAELDKDNDGKISAAEMRAMDSGRSATGTTGSGTTSGSATGRGSTGGMGGSSGPAGTSSGPNPAGEAPRGGISK